MSRGGIAVNTTVESLRRYYSVGTALAINKYMVDFMPYMENFGSIECSFIEQSGNSLLHLECQLFVPPPRGFSNDTGSGRSGDVSPIYVLVVFPPTFPSVSPYCALRVEQYRYKNITQWMVRPSSRIVAQNGALQLSALPLLKGTTAPYTLMGILVAVADLFEVDFPLVPINSDRPTGAVSGASENAGAQRALIQPAAEALMVHLMSKAEGYLDTRDQARVYLNHLFKSRDALREARDMLQDRKNELMHYSPAVGEVESLLSSMSTRADDLVEHSQCLVPVDALQARALELLGEIHASDDALDLLERSLRIGQLSCDEYVRLVSDVGRKQFEARFLFARVTEAVSRTALHSPREDEMYDQETGNRLGAPPRREPRPRRGGKVPAIPEKIDILDLLHREFPEVGKEMIKAVLNLADGNLQDARVQLKAMLS